MTAALALYAAALATTMSGMEIFSSVLIGMVGWRFWKERDFEVPPLTWPILAFVAIAWLGTLLGDAAFADKRFDLSRMRFFLAYFAVFFALARFSPRTEDPWQWPWLRTLFWVTAIVSVYGFVQHFVAIDLIRPAGKKVLMYAIDNGREKFGPLVVGTFNHHLTFANVFTFHASVFTALGLHAFPRRKAPLFLGLFLFLLCTWTQSRAAWVAIPVMLVVIGGGKGKKLALGALVAVALLGSVFYASDSGFRERLRRTVFERSDFYNLGPRYRLWAAQIQIFKEHPWLGIGFNNNERHAKQYVDRLYPEIPDNFYGHAHSTPLQVLATMGLFGVLAFVWLWSDILRKCRALLKYYPPSRWEHWLGRALLAGCIGFLIQGVTQWNFGDAEVLHNLMFYWGVLAALWIRIPQKSPAKIAAMRELAPT